MWLAVSDRNERISCGRGDGGVPVPVRGHTQYTLRYSTVGIYVLCDRMKLTVKTLVLHSSLSKNHHLSRIACAKRIFERTTLFGVLTDSFPLYEIYEPTSNIHHRGNMQTDDGTGFRNL
jgi:hypothetical protein